MLPDMAVINDLTLALHRDVSIHQILMMEISIPKNVVASGPSLLHIVAIGFHPRHEQLMLVYIRQ